MTGPTGTRMGCPSNPPAPPSDRESRPGGDPCRDRPPGSDGAAGAADQHAVGPTGVASPRLDRRDADLVQAAGLAALRRRFGTAAGSSGTGCQPAMIRAHSRAFALSLI